MTPSPEQLWRKWYANRYGTVPGRDRPTHVLRLAFLAGFKAARRKKSK
jgi:hypothetical protein